jgi:hypothetical protein
MREIIIVLLIAVVGYLAYDDFYNQRPALRQAQTEIQQLHLTPAPATAETARRPVYVPIARPSQPDWFRKRVEQGSSLDTSHQHTQERERASTPAP